MISYKVNGGAGDLKNELQALKESELKKRIDEMEKELTKEWIIRAPISPGEARRIYDQLSKFYDLITLHEAYPKKKALKMAQVKNGDIVLEVGFGTGKTLIELAKKVGESGKVFGIDISPKMLKIARKRAEKYGFSRRIVLNSGDARKLPYIDNAFDVVFNAYMLDLIDTPEIPLVLSEFKRVLKPGGKLVIVNMSKNKKGHTLYELLYNCGLGVGGCRPVLAKPFLEELNFQNIKRIYISHIIFGSEIVWAHKSILD